MAGDQSPLTAQIGDDQEHHEADEACAPGLGWVGAARRQGGHADARKVPARFSFRRGERHRRSAPARYLSTASIGGERSISEGIAASVRGVKPPAAPLPRVPCIWWDLTRLPTASDAISE